jgi:uncharacterized LabA/DUF88 family protein
MDKVIVYIDGFNLYFGLREKYDRKYIWLDIEKLSRSLLKKDQTLIVIKYFTSRITCNRQKINRQNTYLDALQTLSSVEIYYGHYLINEHVCPYCSHKEKIPTEKMTDVNIATHLLVDSFTDKYDVAILISADSDLVGPVKQVRSLFPNKKTVIAFPPERVSFELKNSAHAYFHIGKQKFQQSQFPDLVIGQNGYPLHRPETWQ